MRSLTVSDLRVGDEATRSQTITAEDVLAFARISGDFNPIHVDADYAARSGFRGQVAHGTLALGIAAGILGTLLPGLGTVALHLSIEFLAPVLVGDTVSARAQIAAIDPTRRRVTIDLRWTNQRGDLIASGQTVVRPPRARE